MKEHPSPFVLQFVEQHLRGGRRLALGYPLRWVASAVPAAEEPVTSVETSIPPPPECEGSSEASREPSPSSGASGAHRGPQQIESPDDGDPEKEPRTAPAEAPVDEPGCLEEEPRIPEEEPGHEETPRPSVDSLFSEPPRKKEELEPPAAHPPRGGPAPPPVVATLNQEVPSPASRRPLFLLLALGAIAVALLLLPAGHSPPEESASAQGNGDATVARQAPVAATTPSASRRPAVSPSGVVHIESIAWTRTGNVTSVFVRGNEALDLERILHYRETSPPAELFTVMDVTKMLSEKEITVATPELSGIRVRRSGSGEVEISLTLPDPAVEVAETRIEPGLLAVRLERVERER